MQKIDNYVWLAIIDQRKRRVLFMKTKAKAKSLTPEGARAVYYTYLAICTAYPHKAIQDPRLEVAMGMLELPDPRTPQGRTGIEKAKAERLAKQRELDQQRESMFGRARERWY